MTTFRLPRFSSVQSLKETQSSDGADDCARRPIAICWRSDREVPVHVTTTEELEMLRALEQDVDHFVDATVDKPRCSKRTSRRRTTRKRTSRKRTTRKKREEADLMPGEVAMLLAFMARRVARCEHARPENLRISNPSTVESKKQAFKGLRRKLDCNTISRQKYALFKSRRSLDGGSQLYEIRPDEGVTFCFIVRPDDFDRMCAVAVP